MKEGDGAVGGPGGGWVRVVLQAPKHGTRDRGWVGETLQALHSHQEEAGVEDGAGGSFELVGGAEHVESLPLLLHAMGPGGLLELAHKSNSLNQQVTEQKVRHGEKRKP